MISPIDKLRDALRAYGSTIKETSTGFLANCPGPNHERGDLNPSLSASAGEDGVALLHCFSGCGTEDILSPLHMKPADLFPNRNSPAELRLVAGVSERPQTQPPITTLEEFCRSRKLDPVKLRAVWGAAVVKRGDGYFLSYPTPVGVNRLKNLFPANKAAKYLWERKLKPEEKKSAWYGLEKVSAGTTELWVPNGEPSVWACHQAGIPAACTAGGEGKRINSALLEALLKAGIKIVHIAFDLDPAGRNGAIAAAQAIRGAGIKVTVRQLPESLGAHGDVGNLFQQSPDRFKDLLLVLPELTIPDERRAVVENGFFKPLISMAEADTQNDVLLALAQDVELLVDENHDGYARYPYGNTKLTNPIGSEEFNNWLQLRYYRETGKALKSQALSEAVMLLKGLAAQFGNRTKVYLRVGCLDGKIYLDLADDQHRVVVIDRDGYRVLEGDAPVIFVRYKGMQALPLPEAGGRLDEIRGLLNLPEEHQWHLAAGWMLSMLQPGGAQPILILTGPEGSLKTTLGRALRGLIDPHAVLLRTLSKDERDLAICAKRNWVLGFDNLSTLPDKLSDAFCQLATGGGFGTRGLYTDEGEKLFYAKRPIMINGIDDAARNSDILSRSVTLELARVEEENYLPDAVINQKLADCRPRVLGALLTIASNGLRRLDSAGGCTHGRMADFIRWIAACEPALGWAPGTFLSDHKRNRDEQVEIALSSDPLADAVVKFMATRTVWQGNATDLKAHLRDCWDDPDKASWNLQNRQIGSRLRRLASSLRKVGIRVDSHTTAAKRLIILERIPESAPFETGNGDDKDDGSGPSPNTVTPTTSVTGDDRDDKGPPSLHTTKSEVFVPAKCPKCTRTMSYIPTAEVYRCDSCKITKRAA